MLSILFGSFNIAVLIHSVNFNLPHLYYSSMLPSAHTHLFDAVFSGADDQGHNAKDQTTFLLYILANSINNSRRNTSGDDDKDAADFTLKELYAIQRIQEEPDVLKVLVQSLCPTIYGHELVKAGLCLALFGGVQRFSGYASLIFRHCYCCPPTSNAFVFIETRNHCPRDRDKNRVPVRGDPHVLVVGDPGLGKSQMLQGNIFIIGDTLISLYGVLKVIHANCKEFIFIDKTH